MKAWRKLDKYFLMLTGVALVSAGLTIYTFRHIFSSVLKAFGTQDLKVSDLKIDKQNLEKAYSSVVEREVVKLNVPSDDTIIEESQE